MLLNVSHFIVIFGRRTSGSKNLFEISFRAAMSAFSLSTVDRRNCSPDKGFDRPCPEVTSAAREDRVEFGESNPSLQG
jgi:hypothetical protein